MARRFIASVYLIAMSSKSLYSMGLAQRWMILRGSLKYTGTVIFDKSFPIESLRIVQREILTLGSLKNGRTSRVGGSYSDFSSSISSTIMLLFLGMLNFARDIPRCLGGGILDVVRLTCDTK